MLHVSVQGGTNAGRTTKRNPLKEPWVCDGCAKRNDYYWKNCPGCGAARPKERG